MVISKKELARRLREARKACGMKQEEVANRLGVSRSSISLMEMGKREVTSLELCKLAYIYGIDVASFLKEHDFEPETIGSLFRQSGVAEKKETREALRRAVAVAREFKNLRSLLGVDRVAGEIVSYDLPAPGDKKEAVDQGEWVASQERNRLNLGDAVIPDMAEILFSQGIYTLQIDLPEDVSGLTLKHKELGIIVAVNSGHHYYRRRFSYAHEYAHVLLDSEILKISREDERKQLLEVRANAFAAAFLMPEEGIENFLIESGKGFDAEPLSMCDVVLLAERFMVSRQVALYRLFNAGFITKKQFKMLEEMERKGFGKQMADLLGVEENIEHHRLREQFSRYFLHLAVEAYLKKLISRRKLFELAEMVGVSRTSVEQILSHLQPEDEYQLDVLLPEEISA